MTTLSIEQMEQVVGGASESDCAWAAAEYVVIGAGAIITGGLALLALPFLMRKTLKDCGLI
jgi:hypothetical protein